MLRFTIRDVLWLMVVVAVVLAVLTGIYRFRQGPRVTPATSSAISN
jgi:hypothetical protein